VAKRVGALSAHQTEATFEHYAKPRGRFAHAKKNGNQGDTHRRSSYGGRKRNFEDPSLHVQTERTGYPL
jgi:hypothetical protein